MSSGAASPSLIVQTRDQNRKRRTQMLTSERGAKRYAWILRLPSFFWLIRFLAYFGVARYRMTGDAVPEPLAFFALRQQHENRTADSLHRVTGRAKTPMKPAETRSRRQSVPVVLLSILMPLAQCAKCRGMGGRAPKARGSTQKPDEPFFSCFPAAKGSTEGESMCGPPGSYWGSWRTRASSASRRDSSLRICRWIRHPRPDTAPGGPMSNVALTGR